MNFIFYVKLVVNKHFTEDCKIHAYFPIWKNGKKHVSKVAFNRTTTTFTLDNLVTSYQLTNLQLVTYYVPENYRFVILQSA